MGAEIVQGTPTVGSDNSETKAHTNGELQRELLTTKLHLLDNIKQADNLYQMVAAAQAFALLSGTLTSTDSIQMRRS